MSEIDFAAGITKKLRSADRAPADSVRVVRDEVRLIEVGVDEVEVFDKNPRLAENDNYGDILESVKERGEFDVTPSVTRRPGAQRYTLRAGAGTRFKILCDLLESTGDRQRYGSFRAIYVPWVSELDTLIAHGVENVARSSLKFYELARMERELRGLICRDDPEFAQATYRERSDRYKSLGLRIPYTYMGLFEFTLERLDKPLHKALMAGMTRQTVVTLKRLESNYLAALSDRGEQVVGEFQSIFDELLSRADGYAFDLPAFEVVLAERTARALDVDLREPADEPSPRPSPATPAAAPEAAARTGSQNPRGDTHSRSTDSRPTPAPAPAPPQAHKPAASPESAPISDSVEEQMAGYRDQAHRIAFALAHDYGLTKGCVYSCLDDQLALGYSIECADAGSLSSVEHPLDAVIVHRELHVLFWSLLNTEIQVGRAAPELLHHFANSDPSVIVDSNTYASVSASELHWRLGELRLLAAAGQVGARYARERRLIEQLDQIQALANRYAQALRDSV